VDEARAETASLNRSPRGLLRLNMPGAFGRLHIMPHISAFLTDYPDIQLDVTLTDAMVDLIEAGADLAIRIAALTDSSLIARRLAPDRPLPVATPEYLRATPKLNHPEDLTRHACILQPPSGWYFRSKGESTDPIFEARRTFVCERFRGRAHRGFGKPRCRLAPELARRRGHPRQPPRAPSPRLGSSKRRGAR